MNSAVVVDNARRSRPWLPPFTGNSLLHTSDLNRLDKLFLLRLEPVHREQLLAYRRGESHLPAAELSELLIACAPLLEQVIAETFGIEAPVDAAREAVYSHGSVFELKTQFVLKRARKRAASGEVTEDFASLDAWLSECLRELHLHLPDRELAVARFATRLLVAEVECRDAIDQLTRWCIAALTTPAGRTAVAGWVSFKLPQATHHETLVPLELLQADAAGRRHGPAAHYRPRDGFKLTDQRMSTREVLGEINYCVLCHDHGRDFCSKGFLKKPAQPELGFKTNALGVTLSGCPLEEKISEMHTLKKAGHSIAALAMIMANNPMCPATGHRICNDCMKSCIYQKQEPVNIPQVETRCLTDVLALPWGVEIYDLLTRWNPLRAQQWLPKPYNGLKVLVCGLGPAGFTLSHHLLMEGFAVVGVDGLKIEPLPTQYLLEPIRDYRQFEEQLDERVVNGFGGVAESGITVRWDKNFLKLIYLTLARRQHFQVFGGVRFGGTITVEEAWQQGFDHVVIAVGSGLSQALPVPGSLAIGMRQASDFLMALQLSGAAQPDSLANLQVRMPAVVIGGGLTGVDAATEVQAYYITQVEKALARYEQLCAAQGTAYVRDGLDPASSAMLEEFLVHGRAVREERERARQANRPPNFIPLLQQWGGVTIAYRRRLQDSPAYIRNHEEVSKAFQEGIFYAEALEPRAAQLDQFGHISGMRFAKQQRDDAGKWTTSDAEVLLPARTVLVATGARPNVAYEFEHRGNFAKDASYYQPHRDIAGELRAIPVAANGKQSEVGFFTSYATCSASGQKRVSYIGDTHPVFHGSVVSAIASGMRAYPDIVAHFGARARHAGSNDEYASFRARLKSLLAPHVVAVSRLAPRWSELTVHAPLAAQRFKPGQFFSLQRFQTHAMRDAAPLVHRETVTLTAAAADRERGTLTFMIAADAGGARTVKALEPGEPVILMGPTGVRARIGEHETVMIISEGAGHAHARATGPALRAKGSRVLHVMLLESAEDACLRNEFAAAADVTLWITARGRPVNTQRPADRAATGSVIEVLRRYAASELGTPAIALQDVQQFMIQATQCTVRAIKHARDHELAAFMPAKPAITAAINAPIQCGLKGVCAQCLHWQVDPVSGKRTKAVFGCSWQDQPLDLIDLDNVAERLGQNRLQEHLTNLWIEHVEARVAQSETLRRAGAHP